MELDAGQLYADKTWVQIGIALNAQQKKDLLQAARGYAESLAIEDLECALERTSSGGLLNWGANKALVLSCDLDPYEYLAVYTLNCFNKTCVLGTYKLLYGDSFFAVNQSAEVRRRVVVDKLKDVETVDYFFMLDRAMDQVGEFLQASVKERLQQLP